MINNVTVGITEISDAGIDLRWKNKLNENVYNVLITKNITNKFIDALFDENEEPLQNIITHATVTGMGGTIIEPNVPNYRKQLDQIENMIMYGFPKERIIIRIDPIIPTAKGLATLNNVLQEILTLDLPKRVRVSVMDLYPHVAERFKKAGVPLPWSGFKAPDYMFEYLNEMLKFYTKEYNFTFEACAEPLLTACEQIGCVNQKDADLFGIKLPNKTSSQRHECLCCGCKKQLLSMNTPSPCPHGCLYCYWKGEPLQPIEKPKEVPLTINISDEEVTF